MVRWPTFCQRTTTVWSIQASPGQTINITLYDFNISSRQTGKYRVCTEYGQLYDDASQHTLTICGSEQRQSHVYRSTGSAVTVHVLAEMTSPPPFFIHYEVLGCADLVPPLNGWFKRLSHLRAVVGCLHSPHSWRMGCDNRRWHGYIGNCTAMHTGEREGKPEYGKHGLSTGIAIAIVLGAAFAVGLVIIIFGLLRYTRAVETVDSEATITDRQTGLLKLSDSETTINYRHDCWSSLTVRRQSQTDRQTYRTVKTV
ncbi:hypothetical protein LSAT2_022283 [Lamellibrachia satsuma]|nr:hypothetical protein LSAT2_022283 [Lamellibrachia satsuma]